MRLNKISMALVILLSLSSSSALAALLCQSGSVVEGRIASICSRFKILDNSTTNVNHDCAGHEVHVEADLCHEPNTLVLTLIKEDGNTKSTDTKKELSWGDGEGNGVFVKCI